MEKEISSIFIGIIVLLLGSCIGIDFDIPAPVSSYTDPRSYQHGIDFLKLPDGNYILIWSSSGIPPAGEDSNGEWSHDIYYSKIYLQNPYIEPIGIILSPGAQEPASSDISQNGHIMITMEDSYQAKNNLAQTFAVFDKNMDPIKEYQNIVYDGGHSGHVASVGNNFVVFYSDEWIDGGGVDNLGSGDDVLLKVYDSTGKLGNEKDVAVGETTRDWWPMIAGSNDTALLLWQQFVDDETYSILMYSIYNPANNEWVKEADVLFTDLKYYTYDAQYIQELNYFLISGTSEFGKGFSFLLSTTGEVVAQNIFLPPIVREAQPAIWKVAENQYKAVFPVDPTGFMILSISSSEIVLEKEISNSYRWTYAGTDGIFLDKDSVYFVSLSPAGIKEIIVRLDY